MKKGNKGCLLENVFKFVSFQLEFEQKNLIFELVLNWKSFLKLLPKTITKEGFYNTGCVKFRIFCTNSENDVQGMCMNFFFRELLPFIIFLHSKRLSLSANFMAYWRNTITPELYMVAVFFTLILPQLTKILIRFYI